MSVSLVALNQEDKETLCRKVRADMQYWWSCSYGGPGLQKCLWCGEVSGETRSPYVHLFTT